MFEVLSLWSGHGMSAVTPLAAPHRPNGPTHWSCGTDFYSDGASFSQCRAPDPTSQHPARHLVYPQLEPGGFWMNGMAYDGERSNALPLVRGALQPWSVNTPGWKFENMEYH